ncbi:ACT domain-containing protein [Amycolatopsis sp. MEPSY49]|uniref:ACT domain-containing protein n=1 Tax=Amycolatopsis sp. MEPSY49 TaxID=3151600 RepID=UPI003EF4D7FB
MTDAEVPPKSAKRARTSTGRELVELAALFIATGVADLFVSTLSHNRVGPVVLFALGGLLIAAVVWGRWVHRPRRDPARGTGDEHPPRTGMAWRVRATVRDVPGSLAGVTAALAAHRFDIVSLQVLAVPDGVVDEFLVSTPESVTAAEIAEVTELGGGRDVRVVPADVHEFVDLPTRLLTIAARTAGQEAGLAQLFRAVLGDCAVERTSAGRRGKTLGEGIDGTTMRLVDSDSGVVVTRPLLPFTSAEFARAEAALDLQRRLAGTAVTIADSAPEPGSSSHPPSSRTR